MLRFVVSGLWLQLGFLDVFKAKPIVCSVLGGGGWCCVREFV